MKRLTWIPTILLFLAAFSTVLAQETRFESSTWEELRDRPYPVWFTDAKLGIFIHWGVYSVPAYSGPDDCAEWVCRGLQTGDSLRIRFMRDHYGDDSLAVPGESGGDE